MDPRLRGDSRGSAGDSRGRGLPVKRARIGNTPDQVRGTHPQPCDSHRVVLTPLPYKDIRERVELGGQSFPYGLRVIIFMTSEYPVI